MRKLLFTFFALILFTSLGWGAVTTADKTVAQLAEANGWINAASAPFNSYRSFNLDANISVAAKHDDNAPANVANGNYSTNWFTYQNDLDGEFTISAGAGCKLSSVKFIYTKKNTATLSLAKGTSQTSEADIIETNSAKAVNAKSVTIYTGNTSTATTNFVRISQFIVTYSGEYFKQSDVTIGLINKGYKNVNLTNLYGDAPLSYKSSDEGVATVTDDGVITPVGEGETTITAYYGANKTGYSTSYTLHVNKGVYYESFSPVAVSDNNFKDFQGDIFGWTSNTIRRKSNDVLVSGQQGLWVQKDKYIQTTTAIEGGVKSIKFKWKQFGNEPGNTLKMEAQWGTSSTFELINQAAEETPIDHEDTKNIEMKSNSQLKFLNNSIKADGANNCRIVLADIQFTPYLLFINKTPSVNCASASTFDFGTIIVNNTDATPEYSMTNAGETGCAGHFNGSVLDLSDVCKDGDIVVKASWGDVFTTTTLHVTAIPAPTQITLNVPSTLNATVGNRFQIIGTLTPADANPNVEWSSSAPGNVSVDQNGVISILNADGATITLKSKANENVKATCTITAAANSDESFIEDYDGFGTWTETGKQTKTGKYSLGWIFRNSKLDGTTLLETGVQGVQLQSGNNYIAYDNATSMEGGVKRVAFQWRAVTASDSIVFDVDDASASLPIYSTKLAANSDYANPQQYSRDVAYNENVFFRIRIASANSSKIIFGPMTITPYLLYKTKSVTLSKSDVEGANYKYANPDIINNTGVELNSDAISYSISGTNADKIAKIKDEDVHKGIVTILGKGTVTVTATWGEVSTSYQLTISDLLTPSISVDESKTIDIYGSYTPKPVAKIGGEEIEGEFTFSSTNTSVIKNDLTVIGTGTTIIRSTLTGTGFYTTAEGPTTVTVNEPTDPNKYWKETFASLTPVESTSYVTVRTPVPGNDGVLDWYCRYFRRCTSGDKVNGEYGIRLNYNSETNNYIEYDGSQEGGIKYLFFNWRRPNASSAAKVWVDITVKQDGKEDISKAIRVEDVAGGEGGQCSRSIKAKKNAKLMIEIPSDGAGVPVIIGPITITPYLLYKTKTYAPTAAECAAASYKYTNEALINNTDIVINATQEDIVFSIVDEDETTQKIAVIDEHTGQVSMRGAGQVTIKATWGDVFTTYQLTIPQLTPTIEFAEPADLELDQTYTPEPKAKIGDYTIPDAAFTYTNIDANVAKMVEGVIYPQSPGTTDVKAVLTATSSYASANTTVSLTVKDYTPEAGKSWPETFADIEKKSGWINEEMEIAGDRGLYNWKAYYHSHAYDFGKVCIRNYSTYRGYLKFNGNHEGGIKFFAFNWQPSTNTGGTVNYKVTVNGDEVSRQQSGLYTTETYRFAHFFNSIADESSLSIEMTDPAASNNTYLVIGDITIMPYLLYTRKAPAPTAEELAADNYKYENKDIINNTGKDLSSSAITFSIVESGKEGVATINENTGEVTVHGAGTVTVKATWEATQDDKVTTTYTLTVPKLLATVTYDDAEITVADTLPLPVAKCNGEVIKGAVYNYATDNAAVIKVSDDQHSLIMVGKGTATITATLQESEQYQGAAAVSASITINSAPANKCFVETFGNVPATTSETPWSNATVNFDGLDNVYKWTTYNYSTYASEQVGLKVGIRNKNSNLGYLRVNDNQEGGIKFIEFDWKPSTNTGGNINYKVTVNANEVPCQESSLYQTTPYHFAHCFNEKVNDLSIDMGAPAASKNTYLLIGDVTIVPYLLYTVKTKDIKIGEKYTNTNLIDNRDNAEKIEYSVTEGDTYASVDEETGEVTGLKEGTATIQAQWGDVTTTYQLTIEKADAIELDETKDNSILIEGYAGTENMTVSLKRTLTAGMSNTFCVPFALSESVIDAKFGSDCKVLEFTGAKLDDQKENLNVIFEEVQSIKAGKPYFIEPASEIENPKFTGVTIVNTTGETIGEGEDVQFIAIINPTQLTPGDKTNLFLVANNRLAWSRSGDTSKMKGMRAYFNVSEDASAALRRATPRLVVNSAHTPTGMVNVNENVNATRKEIINNQLIIIRGGKIYNAQGQIVK